MFSIYVILPSLFRISLACISIISATKRAIEHPVNSPESKFKWSTLSVRHIEEIEIQWTSMNQELHTCIKKLTSVHYSINAPYDLQWHKINQFFMLLPNKNVIRCRSLLAVGRNVFIPFLWFPFAKCLMNACSTLSMSLLTFYNTWWSMQHLDLEENYRLIGKCREYDMMLLRTSSELPT
jgi:hypothetical protein